jgi:hypothetical protein
MMKTVFKLFAFVIGLSSLLFVSNSCKKDDAKECCSFTYDGEHYKYCEGQTVDGEKLTGENWTYFKSIVKDYFDGTCK